MKAVDLRQRQKGRTTKLVELVLSIDNGIFVAHDAKAAMHFKIMFPQLMGRIRSLDQGEEIFQGTDYHVVYDHYATELLAMQLDASEKTVQLVRAANESLRKENELLHRDNRNKDFMLAKAHNLAREASRVARKQTKSLKGLNKAITEWESVR